MPSLRRLGIFYVKNGAVLQPKCLFTTSNE